MRVNCVCWYFPRLSHAYPVPIILPFPPSIKHTYRKVWSHTHAGTHAHTNVLACNWISNQAWEALNSNQVVFSNNRASNGSECKLLGVSFSGHMHKHRSRLDSWESRMHMVQDVICCTINQKQYDHPLREFEIQSKGNGTVLDGLAVASVGDFSRGAGGLSIWLRVDALVGSCWGYIMTQSAIINLANWIDLYSQGKMKRISLVSHYAILRIELPTNDNRRSIVVIEWYTDRLWYISGGKLTTVQTYIQINV